MKVGIIQQHNNANIDDNRNRLASKVTALAAQGGRTHPDRFRIGTLVERAEHL